MLSPIARLLLLPVMIYGCSSSSPETPVGSNGDLLGTNNPDTSDPGANDPAANGGSTATLNADNANAIILQALEVLTGRAYDNRLTYFPYTYSATVGDQTRQLAQNCENAGVVTTSNNYLIDEVDSNYDSFYSDCEIRSDVLNGRVRLEEKYYDTGFSRVFSDNFSVSFSFGGGMDVAGRYAYDASLQGTRELSVSNFNYHFSYSGGTLTVNNANTERWFRLDGVLDENDRHSYMNGSFTMSPSLLGGDTVQVTVNNAFTNSSKATQLSYEQGVMTLTAADSNIVLDADNGDPITVKVVVTDAAGSSSTLTMNWSDWFDALSFVPAELAQLRPPQPAEGDGSVITPDTYKEVLTEVLAVYTGDRFGPAILNLPRYPVPPFADGFLASGAPDGLGNPVAGQCNVRGTAELVPFKYGTRQITSGWNFDFSECTHNGLTYNGSIITRDNGNFDYSSDGFSVTGGGSSTSFWGSLNYMYRANRDGGPSRSYGLRSTTYTQGVSGVFDVLNKANFRYSSASPYRASISGHFSLNSVATKRSLIRVTTADPLVNAREGFVSDHRQPLTNFEAGLLVIKAGNNNSLWLNAANGDPDTFTLTLLQPGKEPVFLFEKWEDWREQLEFNFDLHTR